MDIAWGVMADYASISSTVPVDLAHEPDFWLGALQVRPSTCQVVSNGNSIDLQPKIMKVLVALARAQGSTISFEDLLAVCWGGGVVGDDAIHRCIVRLRRLAQYEAPGIFSIVNQARVGYRLVVQDAVVAEPLLAPTTADAEAPLSGGMQVRSTRWRRFAFGVAASLALALAIAFVIVTRPTPSVYRIAVRDFKAEGLGPRVGERLADRIAAAVSDRQLPVVTRARSSQGDFDGAHYIVGGDIQRVGDKTKVNIQLDDVSSGLTLWTDTISRSSSELDALQDQVAGKVADLMDLTRLWLGPHGEAAEPEAVAALLKATDTIRNQPGQLLQTREAFRQFRDLAPGSSRAHSGYAMATVLSSFSQPRDVAAQWRTDAAAEANRAISLDPKNGESYIALGLLTPTQDYARREAWFLRGMLTDPNNASLQNFLGCLLLDVGRIDEAVVWIDRSVKLDPLSPPKTQSMIDALSIDGHFVDADNLIARAERLWPDDVDMRRAIFFRTLINASPTQALASLARFQTLDKPLPADRAEIWRLFENVRAGKIPATLIEKRFSASRASLPSLDQYELDSQIAALALLGDKQDAFRTIDASRAMKLSFDPSLLFEPATQSLRNDPRFIPITATFGLDRYWMRTKRKPDFCTQAPTATVCS